MHRLMLAVLAVLALYGSVALAHAPAEHGAPSSTKSMREAAPPRIADADRQPTQPLRAPGKQSLCIRNVAGVLHCLAMPGSAGH
jgi:hypothetical protein